MTIYNVTTKVDWSIAEEWLQWMLDVHIPGIISTGGFEKYQLVKLLQLDDVEGPTYAVQYFAKSNDNYERFISNYSAQFTKDNALKWGDKFISFSSLMEVVQ